MAVQGNEFTIAEYYSELDAKAYEENIRGQAEINLKNAEIKKKNLQTVLIVGAAIGVVLAIVLASTISGNIIVLLIGLILGFAIAYYLIKPKLFYYQPIQYFPRGIVQCSSCAAKIKIDDKPRDFVCRGCGGEFFVWSEKENVRVEATVQRK